VKNTIFKTLPFYLPNISWYAQYLQSEGAQLIDAINKKEHKIKQTILAASTGALQLSIPIQGGRAVHQPISKVLLCKETSWQETHFKSIKSVYGKAPFFEYFKDEIAHFYTTDYRTLMEFNMGSILLINQIAGVNLPITIIPEEALIKNFSLVNYKYSQVFMPKASFVPNCSMLDLLLNEGRSSIIALRNIKTI
jgi:hypothetical protein